MTTFEADLSRFLAKVETRRTQLFVNTANAVKNSITEGSAVTGAPGQPVDTGTLKASWQLLMETADRALIATPIAYAPAIEEGTRTAYDPRGIAPPRGPSRPHRKSTVGGSHSVKLTRANLDGLVRVELQRVLREVP